MITDMLKQDSCVSTMPWFEIFPEKLEFFKRYCREYIEITSQEAGCLYYGFTFNGHSAHCRECYLDAEGVLAHLINLQDLNTKTLNLARITRFEIHGPAEELEKLRPAFEFLTPEYYELEIEFRRAVDFTRAGWVTEVGHAR
ncbi:hypothetical protein KKJ06_12845 [Xenorhabdus bovienii]|uniref:putative quinol monooxygenase n=1 Tax=Xenorhabdus bovienii TaxID=40576 RepID=UPI0023B21CAA|nr:hypothetical protein [Xenorhabdus bovienii]MDE9482418.1 hypothetical protein [Xenorhabdus bovienii]MDE9556294.1 hypothetical protein [Xenorhabdus bovienii]